MSHDLEKTGQDAVMETTEHVVVNSTELPTRSNTLVGSDTDSCDTKKRSLSLSLPSFEFVPTPVRKTGKSLWKFLGFIGPGFMVAVAYIDPGNYSTDVSAGAGTRYSLLFVVLMSNIFAVVLQSLAIRLGSVTGMDLAQMCRAHLPWWLNWILYFFAEAAIIATDIAEVIGSAIALNLLGNIPLVAGCAITILEVLVILVFYQPNGSMRGVKVFEYLMVGLVLGVVVCFCIQLSTITNSTVGEVFYGYVPTSAVVTGSNLYLSCGILGATVMPHSLYLGSGLCQPRLKAYDDEQRAKAEAEQEHAPPQRVRTVSDACTLTDTLDMAQTETSKSKTKAKEIEAAGVTLFAAESVDSNSSTSPPSTAASIDRILAAAEDRYIPSLGAIKHCLTISTVELIFSLCIFALFVNSAILIVAGSSLYGNDAAADADLFGIYDLLSVSISKAAGTIFAVALLLSGLSAGIVCTIAGQMVSEGAINWTIRPWIRQLITRVISIVPSIVIAAAVGKEGLNAALNGTQVALSVILPFVSAPLVYFTCRSKYMTVGGGVHPGAKAEAQTGVEDGSVAREKPVVMKNHFLVSALAIGIWLVIAIMNVALLVFTGKGEA